MMGRLMCPLEQALQSAAPDQPATGCQLQRLIDAFMDGLRARVERQLGTLRGTQAVTNEVLEATAAHSGSPMPVHARTAALVLHLRVDGPINNWRPNPTALHL